METSGTGKNGAEQQAGSEQLLTFIVNGDEYGVDILRVQEIRGWSSPMPVPNTPSYIKGVINIRGDVVPIADLRERLGIPTLAYGPMTVIIVLRVQAERERIMGIIVDAMSDVTNVPLADMKRPPDFGAQATPRLTKAIATMTDKMITILDVDQIFATVPAALTAAAA
jgi:purine-binding chemotaxis protein CheW